MDRIRVVPVEVINRESAMCHASHWCHAKIRQSHVAAAFSDQLLSLLAFLLDVQTAPRA
jgi:hypothetical protein